MFNFGVQTGDVTPHSVRIHCRQYRETTLTLLLARGVEDGWKTVLEVPNLKADNGVVQTEITDLVPDTTYAVVFYRPDGLIRSAPSRFRTALYPDSLRIVRFGAVSCLGSEGAPWPCLSQAAAEKLDAFLFLGDTIYADQGDRPLEDYEGHWADTLQMSGMRDLTASTSVVATWDDHEVDNNWSYETPGVPELAATATTAFRRGLPQQVGPGGTGLWRKLTWGATVELFVLDCRGERRDGDYISSEQMGWLKSELTNSQARFKLILNSVPITDMNSVYLGVGAEDRWDGFPDARAEILNHITFGGIEGVLWVSGDFHWGAVARIGANEGDDGFDQTEVFAGPGGSTINPLAFVVARSDRYPEVIAQRNYALLELDPIGGVIVVSFVDEDGKVIAARVLDL